ncbi:hypothetical protein ACT3UJ_06430 [Halomonas sp. 86]|uniref:hypothetical protein n=1 Tax=unclassified Halomonas TaxID=2609666 RepID=UPI004034CEEE
MMFLNTWILESTLESVRLAWSTGSKNGGTIVVDFPQPMASYRAIAECVAIRHLMFVVQVFDRLPLSGEGFTLQANEKEVFEYGQCGRISQHILPFARYLIDDLPGATFLPVDPSSPLLDVALRGAETRLEFDEYNHSGNVLFEFPTFGKVRITPHAVERYKERNADFIKSPRRSLMKFLQREDFKKMDFPDSVMAHKAKQYGPNDPVELWKQPGSHLYLIMIIKPGSKVLATCFEANIKPVTARQKTLQREAQEEAWREMTQAKSNPELEPAPRKKQIRIELDPKG